MKQYYILYIHYTLNIVVLQFSELHNKNSVSYDVRINIGRMGKDSVA